MTKKIIKIVFGVVLVLLVAFMLLVRFGKPTNSIILKADNNEIALYQGSVITYISDDDEAQDNNETYCPKTFFNPVDFQSNNLDVQVGGINYYNTNNLYEQYKLYFKIKTIYQNAIALYLYNDVNQYLLCYYNVSPNGPIYSYTPQFFFALDSSYGGVFTIPSNYTYDLYSVSNSLNLDINTLLAYQTIHPNTTSTFNNYILLTNASNGNYNVGYNVGYQDGQNEVINNPSNYNLYNEIDYLGYGQTKFNEGADSDLTTNGFRIMLSTIFNAPYQILQPILNFEFMGVNLWNLFTFVISIFLVIYVVSIFRGNR